VNRRVASSALASVLALGCGQVAYKAVDQAAPRSTEHEGAGAIQAPAGFRAVRVVEGLNYPSSMTWDDQGRLYILESHMVPVPVLEPRLLRVAVGGKLEELELEGGGAPSGDAAIGLQFHDGWLYLSHQEKDGKWGISRLRPSGGEVEAVVRGMRGDGDHNINYLAFDGGGALYFGVGSATNSGVVSSHDPVNHKWLAQRQSMHDIPCRDLTLRGLAFTEDNALTEATDDKATTGAFAAYGQAIPRQVAGEALCTGAVYRLRPGAAQPEMIAWGFRNPVALAFAADGGLLIGMHGADVRSTRPVLDDPDAIYRLREGAWYGWPDYSAALLPLTDPRYRSPATFFGEGMDKLEPVIDLAASGLRPPDRSWLVAATEPHAALGGMVVVPKNGPFRRWAGQLLISEMGDFRPTTDAVHPDVHAGFQVEAVDLRSGKRTVFARNRGSGPALPASRLDLEDGLERPVDVKVGPDGLVYVLDFGVFEPTAKAAQVMPKTGKVFRFEPLSGTRPGR
jgi:glucose/arabinose dehydrogenase